MGVMGAACLEEVFGGGGCIARRKQLLSCIRVLSCPKSSGLVWLLCRTSPGYLGTSYLGR
jgi:hypothetical protein